MLKAIGLVYNRQHLQNYSGFLSFFQRRHLVHTRTRHRQNTSTAVLEAKRQTTHKAQSSSADDSPCRTTDSHLSPSSQQPTHELSSHTQQGCVTPRKRTHKKPQEPTSQRESSQLSEQLETLFKRTGHAAMLAHLRSSSLSEHFLDRTKATKLAETMVHDEEPQRSLKVLHLAHMLGCSLKPSAYECVAHGLVGAKHWDLVPKVLRLAKKDIGRVTVRLLNWRVLAMIECSQFGGLEGTLDDFASEGLKPNRRTFHLLISGHLRNHNLRSAKDAIIKMEDGGFEVTASTHARIVSVYRPLGSATDVQNYALEALQDLDGHLGTITLNSVLQLSIDARDKFGILRALSLFHHESGHPSLAVEFGALFTLHDGNDSTILERQDIKIPPTPPMPDAATFTILINYAARRRDLATSLRLVQRMQSLKLRPDASTTAALMRSFFLASRQAAAVRIAADMCSKHVPETLFDALGLSSQPQYEAPFRAIGIPLAPTVFNALMRGVIDDHGLKGARRVLRIMQICKVDPDAKTIEIFMSHLEKAGGARPRELILVLRNLTSTKVPPTLDHVHIIMKSVLRREKLLIHGSGWDVTAAKFSPRRLDMSRYPEGLISGRADSFDPTAGIELPRKLSYRALIKPIIQSLSSRQIKSNRKTMAIRLRHEAIAQSDIRNAEEVYREMLARGMRPTSLHYAALMEGYALSGNLRTAKTVMASALEAGIPANVVMYTILIVGYARQGHPEQAMRVFQNMIAVGIRPDIAAVDALASAYFAVGDYQLAKRVLLSLWDHVKARPEDLQRASLKQLAQTFRLRHSKRNNDDFLPRKLNKSEGRLLRWKIARLVRVWKAKRLQSRRYLSALGMR